MSILSNIKPKERQYTKDEIQMHQCDIWNTLIQTNYMESLVDKQSAITKNQEDLINTIMVISKNQPTPVFNRQDKQSDNTDLLDFLHGRSKHFKLFKNI